MQIQAPLPYTIEILPLTNIAITDQVLAQIETVLISSSSRTAFSSPMARAAFVTQWLHYYRVVEPNLLFVAREVAAGHIVGYVSGCQDSASAAAAETPPPAYDALADCVARFPAHLHVNCLPAHRGAGIGTRLVNRLCVTLRARHVCGLHVVTTLAARNVAFYQRCGFRPIAVRAWRERQLLCLGRRP